MPTAEEVLAQQSEEYKNAPRFSTWQPPDGDYIESIEDVRFGWIGQGANRRAATFIDGCIRDGDYDGKKNGLGMFSENNLGMLGDVVEALGGDNDAMPNTLAAGKFVQTYVGKLVQVRVSTRKDKQGVDRTNATIVSLIPDVPAT